MARKKEDDSQAEADAADREGQTGKGSGGIKGASLTSSTLWWCAPPLPDPAYVVVFGPAKEVVPK